MKKKTVLALSLAAILSFSACGNTSSGEPSEKDIENRLEALDKKPANEAEKEIEKNLEKLDETAEKTTAAETEKPKGVDWAGFEPMEEMYDPDNDDAVQIGDVVIHTPALLSEVIDTISQSSIEWKYDYNPDKLVPYENYAFDFWTFSFETLSFKCEDKSFSLAYLNMSPDKETVALKDTYVIEVRGTSLNATAVLNRKKSDNFCYFYGGYGIDGKNVPAYTEYIKNLKDNGISYEESTPADTLIYVSYQENYYKEYDLSAVDTKIKSLVFRNAFFNTETGECVGYYTGRNRLLSRQSSGYWEGYDKRHNDLPKFGE